MEYLYLWLNIGSFIIPFLFSFHPRLRFYRKWKQLFSGILIMMAIFIPWDIFFTHYGIWGFNPDYLIGIDILGIPLEEWLFFICIPYACIFTHYALLELFPRFYFGKYTTATVYITIVTTLIILLWYYYDIWYTLVNFCFGLFILALVQSKRSQLLPSFFATYMVILIPFFIVNGILTGTGIEEQVVWYNNAENLGIRLKTIPVEDLIYNLGMLLTVLFISEVISEKKEENNTH